MKEGTGGDSDAYLFDGLLLLLLLPRCEDLWGKLRHGAGSLNLGRRAGSKDEADLLPTQNNGV